MLYWRYQSKHAIRMNDWKLVKEYGSLEPELYNLSEDVSETKDLAQLMPDKVTELEIAWNAWNDQLQSPMWKRQDARTENRRATNQPTEVRRGVDVENRFRQMDRNGDGVLSKDEIERPGLLRLMDQNGDGVVTKGEANATYTPTNRPTNGQGN
ncbi:MAG: hypothetical protein HC898_03045 [Phycisphaerales bacterium]|nr:hypothetical protein [Phycisphaerales bacterium]